MYFHPKLFNRFVIIGTDHPLSLGYQVYLFTDWHGVEKAVRMRKKDKALLHSNAGRSTPSGEACSGMHVVWDKFRAVGIYITGEEDGKPLTTVRFLELLVHETSHAVDYFFERAKIEKIDTEVRAYHLDWMVGKALHHVPAMA